MQEQFVGALTILCVEGLFQGTSLTPVGNETEIGQG